MELYRPQEDPYYSQPYIDVSEWREKPVHHYYVHGGFAGTEKMGKEAKFCFYFPVREHYEGRFFQYLSPAPEDERHSEYDSGENDKILFVLTHGAYYVVSNQGGFILNEGERLYRTSANTAEFGRKVAQQIYGYKHRPYGYVFGGSGGSFKTISCLEMTDGVWDGGVPFVVGNPMAAPNAFCHRVRAMRVLGREGLERIVDNMEPGGSGNLYDGLNREQREVLEETTRMGFPKRAWFCHSFMGDGALMVLAPYIYAVYPQYFTDFWIKNGYAGADPNSTEVRDRVQFVTTVKALIKKEDKVNTEVFNNVENSWQNTMMGNIETPEIVLEKSPEEGTYLFHCRIRVLSGAAKGKECNINTIENSIVTVNSAFGGSNGQDALAGLAVGDEIMIDNSDYLAMQTLYRHQVPDNTYRVYDQFRKKDGSPKYPQLPVLIAPLVAQSGGGSVPCGNIHGKVITVCSLQDESAQPWFGDWYREAVRRNRGENIEEWHRLYYNDNCIHADVSDDQFADEHVVDYLGVLHQALLDLANWCEKGVIPAPTTNYIFEDGQILIPETADERGGLQPVVRAWANNEKCVHARVGEKVIFTAEIEVPGLTGKVTEAAWSFEGRNDFSTEEVLELQENGKKARTRTVHCFNEPGTYFPTIKVKSSRTGTKEDIFIQCKNLDRVRVIVT